ncbi:glucuronoxylan 4-O-methyltransferase 3-like [Phoenix dactylifera]|uniref:Glucuronoxylan 4-O-methyltransferase 3 n=1 Tax=Phoenix dactylifera TaxID=42345 RepID=A0A8B7BJ44_PHODC|nr:glucuronoxylan 4-O-methyltransferase 3 [Phoenix dactylifera]XP_038979098.1 glucuronoxylan 4-O-methyltransferase 3-like [Phoenix dactylifera]
MRSKIHGTLNPKLFFLGFFLLFILYFVLRSNLSSSPYPPTTSSLQFNSSEETQASLPSTTTRPTQSCTKIPPSLANTIIHYATSNTTPQQTIKEISITAQVLERRSPCNFLVFGLGRDSLMWTALNHGGRTVFLEEDRQWIETVQQELPTLEAYHVRYDTKVSQAEELLELGQLPECTTVGDMRLSKCRLALKGLPEVFFEVEWDLIMVDAPTGYFPGAPGRMGAIYTAGMAARWRKEGETDVFVHDVNRLVEDRFSKKFLCEGYMRQEKGFLRHFTIPSHRSGMAMPFCPN